MSNNIIGNDPANPPEKVLTLVMGSVDPRSVLPGILSKGPNSPAASNEGDMSWQLEGEFDVGNDIQALIKKLDSSHATTIMLANFPLGELTWKDAESEQWLVKLDYVDLNPTLQSFLESTAEYSHSQSAEMEASTKVQLITITRLKQHAQIGQTPEETASEGEALTDNTVQSSSVPSRKRAINLQKKMEELWNMQPESERAAHEEVLKAHGLKRLPTTDSVAGYPKKIIGDANKILSVLIHLYGKNTKNACWVHGDWIPTKYKAQMKEDQYVSFKPMPPQVAEQKRKRDKREDQTQEQKNGDRPDGDIPRKKRIKR